MGDVIRFLDAIDGDEQGQQSTAFYRARMMWIKDLVTADISDKAQRVGCFLALHMNGTDQSCWWPQERIAQELGTTRVTISRAVNELKRKGFISVESGKTATANTYRLRNNFDT